MATKRAFQRLRQPRDEQKVFFFPQSIPLPSCDNSAFRCCGNRTCVLWDDSVALFAFLSSECCAFVRPNGYIHIQVNLINHGEVFLFVIYFRKSAGQSLDNWGLLTFLVLTADTSNELPLTSNIKFTCEADHSKLMYEYTQVLLPTKF
ncbi:unnamed protein product [Larinioides sclopetarius]|uniref:Uncharacterized protein n=1 Tax=Larinioides sclopetarius TaxID=280406 RepID=A0AAV2BVR6_9ARAC